jgi:uncharacterized metal-binding protein YceD (DUF177 family)
MNWSVKVPLHQLDRGPVRHSLEPTAEQRAEAAKLLAIPAVDALSAEVTVSPWMDGAAVEGRWRARIQQTCGVTLDPFETELSGEFRVTAVPAGSPNAPSEDPEETFDLDAPDPPDVLHAQEVDVAAYVVEHLALELDPFPRKPGVEWEAPEPDEPPSPFAVLSRLKPQ